MQKKKKKINGDALIIVSLVGILAIILVAMIIMTLRSPSMAYEPGSDTSEDPVIIYNYYQDLDTGEIYVRPENCPKCPLERYEGGIEVREDGNND